MAEQLIGSFSGAFDATRYSDEYRDNLMKVIRAKLKGKKIEAPEEEAKGDTEVIDLMSRLRESLERGRGEAASVRPKRKAAASAHRPVRRRTRSA